MQRGPDSWHQRRSRDRNLDIFDKALIRFEQRGGRRAPQQLQSQPNLHRPRHREVTTTTTAAAAAHQIHNKQPNDIAELRGEPAGDDSEMSRYQYSRSRVSSTSGGGGGLLLPHRTLSNVGGGLSGSGFQRQEVFRRSFRQAPAAATSSSRQSQSFYSQSNTGGAGGFLARPPSSAMLLDGGGGMRVSVSETSSALGRQHQQQQQQLGGAGSAAAYFSEGLVINPGNQHQHQQQYQIERQQLQHGSTGSVERELLNYRLTDGGVSSSSSRFHQVSHAASSPENVHSEGFLIQRRTIGPWQNAARDASIREQQQQQQQQQVVEHHHQRQQSGGEYPVLRMRQPYKMNFVMSREAPAAYHSSAASDAVREQFASHLYNNRRNSGRQSVMGLGDSNRERNFYHQQHTVYHDNRGTSPRAFVPYPQAVEAMVQTTLTRSGGYGTIKEGTIHKDQAAEKSRTREHDIEVGLSRLELQQAGVSNERTTTTKTSHAEHNKLNALAQEDAAAAELHRQQQQAHRQFTVSKVATQNEEHKEEATYFHDGNQVKKRVKRSHYMDGKLTDEKEDVVSLNDEERKQMDAQQRQWQWRTSTNANGQTTTTTTEASSSSHHTGQTVPASSSETRAGTTTTSWNTTSSTGVRPKKRACACCYPRHRRYKSDTGVEKSNTTTTTTTTTTSNGKPGKQKKWGKKKQAAEQTAQAAEQQNGRARQVAFESVYD